MRRINFTVLCLLLVAFSVSPGKAQMPVDTLAKVFHIGDHTEAFEHLFLRYNHLASQLGQDHERAYAYWTDMLQKMDLYSEEIGVDLNGLQLLLYAFWDPNGRLEHLAYFLKPNSKFIEDEVLNDFFLRFIDAYQLPVTLEKPTYLFTHAAFPTVAKRLSSLKKH